MSLHHPSITIQHRSNPPLTTTRRELFKSAATAALAGFTTSTRAQFPREQAKPDFRVRESNIRQSVMGWCFRQQPNPMPVAELIRHCKNIGIVGIEGISPQFYPLAKEAGMEISLVGSHGFQTGPNDPKNHDLCIQKLIEGIDLAVEFGSPNVITFVGMKGNPLIDDEEAKKNCVQVWKKVLGHAEKQKINICLEHLNSVDESHPMKGHPGYQGDRLDFCIDVIKQCGSPRMKLLFDVYHVQIMHGDLIRNIRLLKDYIGHYHTAGNPGRGELDDTQEINYPAVMRAILNTGFKGFVAQEFIPTWEDKAEALRHAAQVCDI